MKKIYSTILFIILTTTIIHAQYKSASIQYGWMSSGSATIGEAVVATITVDPPTAGNGSYVGAQIVGQVIDGNGNWGQALPVVANFKLNVNFSNSTYTLVQDVITPNVTLELKSISATQINLVANVLSQYNLVSILYRFPVGSGTTVSLGNSNPNSSGVMLKSAPTYVNAMTGRLAINVADATKAQTYKLAVGGSIIAESVTVKLQSTWPDFVFKKGYELPTLREVKQYIEKNKHLPDMPSADEVEKEGVDLGEITRLLLKKVEELTLYLIKKDEQINKLKTEQQEQIDLQKTQLEEIRNQLFTLIH